ncbi:tail fiber protein [Pseudomonas phage SNK]|nr:tail fiber protein [Pseudomonas phage SNK]
MATTPKTVRTFTLDGAKKDFTIPFEYLARKFVVVTLIGATRRELILNTEYRFSTATTITTTKAWGPADNFDLIEIRRLTSATERLVDFADGSILRAYDLNISQVQSLHIAEEARDLTADTIGVNNDGDLDARARKIVNLADGVNDGDAVNLRQQKQWAGSALNSANASAASAAASEASRQAAAGQAAAALTSAQNAAGSNSAAAAQAGNSANSASASQTSRLASEAARDLSQAWASKAEDQVVSGSLYSSYHYSRKSAASAAASQTSATNSASSASFATTEANRATTEANRAKTEADKLGSFNGLAAAIDGVSTTTVTWKGKQISKTGGFQANLGSDNEANFSFTAADGSDPIRLVRTSDRVIHIYDNASSTDRVQFGPSSNIFAKDSTFNSKLSVAGAFAGSSGIFSQSVRVGSVMQVIPQTNNTENTHLWFRDVDASTERALIYADSGRQLHIRANGGSGGEALVRSDNSWTFANGIEVTRNSRQPTFFAPNRQTDGAMYNACQLQLQGTGSGIAALGFHNAGRVAGGLWLNDDNWLYWMQNSGNNHLLLTPATLFGSGVSNMTSDIVGCIATMQNVSGANQGQNAVLGGGSLRFSTHNNPSGTAGSGSWRNLGWSNNGGVSNWIRYA